MFCLRYAQSLQNTDYIMNRINMEEILKAFSQLTDIQKEQFASLMNLYKEWNSKINVISRKDIDHLYIHHVLHSLSIARYVRWKSGTRILDFGTGGGFPGIPLAIMFPECHFKMIDGTGKKIKVVNAVASSLGLKNVDAVHLRGEEEKDKFDYVVSRAVMQMPDLVKIIRKNISGVQRNALPNGLICLKGGDIKAETRPYCNKVDITPVSTWFDNEWFTDKYLVYLPL